MEPIDIVPCPGPPLVSVVIPVYNRTELLGETIASCQAQTLRAPVEVILVDDGSTVDVEPAVRRAARPGTGLRLVRRPNGGPGAARNTGSALVRGRYVQFLDSDDLVNPAKFAAQVEVLERTPGADYVTCIWNFFRDRIDRQFGHYGPRRSEAWPILPSFLQHENWPSEVALVRRSSLPRFGPWPEDMRNYEDWTWWIRGGLRGAAGAHVRAPLLHVRQHDGPRISRLDSPDRAAALGLLNRRLREEDWSGFPGCRPLLADFCFEEACQWLSVGDEGRARQALDHALAASPSPVQRARLRAVWRAAHAPLGSRQIVRAYAWGWARRAGLRARWHARQGTEDWLTERPAAGG